MNQSLLMGYENLVRRIDEAEQRDPKLKELKEHLRAATAFVARAADDNEMKAAIRAENESIAALFQHVYGSSIAHSISGSAYKVS